MHRLQNSCFHTGNNLVRAFVCVCVFLVLPPLLRQSSAQQNMNYERNILNSGGFIIPRDVFKVYGFGNSIPVSCSIVGLTCTVSCWCQSLSVCVICVCLCLCVLASVIQVITLKEHWRSAGSMCGLVCVHITTINQYAHPHMRRTHKGLSRYLSTQCTSVRVCMFRLTVFTSRSQVCSVQTSKS